MRVIHVLKVVDADGGGVQSYVRSAAEALADSSVEVVLGGLNPGRVPDYRAKIAHMGTRGVSRWRNLLQFWRWLLADIPGAQVVHIHNIFGAPLLLAALACLRLGVPYVVSPHGRLVATAVAEMDWRHRIYLKFVALPLLRRAACLIVTADSNLQDLQSVDTRLKAMVVHPGISPEGGPHSAPAAADALRIGFIGRLIAVKNLPTLLHAVASLRADGVPACADIIGWSVDGYGERMQELARKLGIDAAVTFHGKRVGREKTDIVRAAHVMAVPSFRENFSFVTAEALALGIPVVASATVGIAPVLTRYGCGSVVDARDVSAWARALRIYADPAVRALASRRAVECSEREFSSAAMRDALCRAYQQAGPVVPVS